MQYQTDLLINALVLFLFNYFPSGTEVPHQIRDDGNYRITVLNLSPDLNKGVTLFIFQDFYTLEEARERLKMNWSFPGRSSDPCFNNAVLILSKA